MSQAGRQPVWMRWAFKVPDSVFDLLIRFLNDIQDNKLPDFSDPNWQAGSRVVSSIRALTSTEQQAASHLTADYQL